MSETSNSPQLEDEFAVSGRFDAALWRRVLSFGRPYRRWFVRLSLIATVAAAIEIGIPVFVGEVIDAVREDAASGTRTPLGPWLAVFLAMVAAFSLAVFGFIFTCGQIVTHVSRDIRRECFTHLQALHFGYFDRKPVGWLMSRLTGDTNLLGRIMAWAMLDIVWGVLCIVGITATMLVLNWRLALVTLAIVPPLFLLCRWFQWRLLLTSRLARQANSHLTAAYNESLTGVRTTKSLTREAANLGEFGVKSSAMFEHSVKHAVYAAAFWPMVVTVCSVAVALVLWYGGLRTRDGLTLGELVQFIGLATLFAQPITELARTITMILGAQASAERIVQVLDTEPAIRDSDAVKEKMRRHADAGRSDASDADDALAEDGHPDGVTHIAFDDVRFHYKPEEPVLRGVSFEVDAGQTVALVGETGGGKSTIVSLVGRFYEPTGGAVLFDGIDTRERSLAWLQRQLGIVLQTPQLFSGTIRENIRYGRLDATDAEVEEAATLVNAHGFITELPKGYDEAIGEGGNQLSVGQKQLIALARAILADPRVFIMDEATSSVDTETEKLIQAAVDRVLTGRIAFVIAHRLSTIRNADQILVVNAGEIVERGTHDELLALGGRYHELYTNQFTTEAQEHALAGDG